MNQYYVIYFNDPNRPQVSLIKSDSHTEAEATVKNMWDHSIRYITSVLVNKKKGELNYLRSTT
mgnify:CR=1 FL=1